MIHELKCAPEFFEAALQGRKPFEVRKKDRDYQVGDFAALNEWNNDHYTGRCFIEEITYILDDPRYCKEGYIIMTTELCAIQKRDDDVFRVKSSTPLVEGAARPFPGLEEAEEGNLSNQ